MCIDIGLGANVFFVFFQAEDGIRDIGVTGVQTCALPISGGVDVVIVDDIKKCSEQIFSHSDDGFNVVIIDMHLQNSGTNNNYQAIELAKTIKNAIPDQRIVITSTSLLTEVNNKLMSLGITEQDVLIKPFSLSTLLSIIRTHSKE